MDESRSNMGPNVDMPHCEKHCPYQDEEETFCGCECCAPLPRGAKGRRQVAAAVAAAAAEKAAMDAASGQEALFFGEEALSAPTNNVGAEETNAAVKMREKRRTGAMTGVEPGTGGRAVSEALAVEGLVRGRYSMV